MIVKKLALITLSLAIGLAGPCIEALAKESKSQAPISKQTIYPTGKKSTASKSRGANKSQCKKSSAKHSSSPDASTEDRTSKYVDLVKDTVTSIMDAKELATYPINVVILFTISSSGKITDWQFSKKSNFATVNNSFKTRIKSLPPFPAPPKNFSKGLTIQIDASRQPLTPKSPPYFNCKEISEQTYSVSPMGEPIEHKLTKREGSLGDYKIDFENCDDFPIKIILHRKGKLLLKKELAKWQGLSEPHFVFFDPIADMQTNYTPVARDIDNDGKAEMVVVEASEAGGHPADRLMIYKLDGSDVLRCTFDRRVIEPEFEDIDHDGRYEIWVKDNTFAAWLGSSDADSIYPQIALEGADYKPNARFMKYKPTEQKALDAYVLNASKKLSVYPKKTGYRVIIPVVWTTIIDLVYQGNSDKAKEILYKLYPGDTRILIMNSDEIEKLPQTAESKSKQEFWNMLCEQLKKSEYFEQIKTLNPNLTAPLQ